MSHRPNPQQCAVLVPTTPLRVPADIATPALVSIQSTSGVKRHARARRNRALRQQLQNEALGLSTPRASPNYRTIVGCREAVTEAAGTTTWRRGRCKAILRAGSSAGRALRNDRNMYAGFGNRCSRSRRRRPRHPSPSRSWRRMSTRRKPSRISGSRFRPRPWRPESPLHRREWTSPDGLTSTAVPQHHACCVCRRPGWPVDATPPRCGQKVDVGEIDRQNSQS